jgi:hypothetical protein
MQLAGGDSARRGGDMLARHLVIESLLQPVVGAAAGLLASCGRQAAGGDELCRDCVNLKRSALMVSAPAALQSRRFNKGHYYY